MSVLNRLGKFKKVWIRLFGLLIFALLLLSIDYEHLFQLLHNAKFGYLFAGMSLVLLSIAVKAFRWTSILKEQEIFLQPWTGIKYYAAGLFLGLVTPARAGDFGKIFYLRRMGYSYGKSAFSLVLDRLLDILALFLIGAVGALMLLGDQKRIYVPLILALSTAFFLTVLVVIGRDFVREKLPVLIRAVAPKRLKEIIADETQDFLADIPIFLGRGIISIAIQTVVFWSIYMSIYFLMSKAVGADLSYLQLVTAVSVSAVISFLPISIAGIGTRDAFLIFIFHQWGIAKEKAMLFSFCFLAFYLVSSSFGYLCFHLEPIALEKGS